MAELVNNSAIANPQISSISPTALNNPILDQTINNSSLPEEKKTRGWFKKFLFLFGGLLIVISILAGIVYLFFAQIYFVIAKEVFFSKTQYPWLYEKPSVAQFTSITGLEKYVQYTFENLTFSVPWSDKPDIQETDKSEKFTFGTKVIAFLSTKDYPSENPRDFLKNADISEDQFAEVFGNENIKSAYALKKSTLNTTPEQITLATSPERAVGLFVILPIKKALVLTESHSVINFSSPVIKGFQFGKAGVDNGISIDFYDNQERLYTVIVSGKTVSQQDIDFILSSIKIDKAETNEIQKNIAKSSPAPTVVPSAKAKSQDLPSSSPLETTTQPFRSAGLQTVEEEVAINMTNAATGNDLINTVVVLENKSQSSKTVAIEKISMRSPTQGTSNKQGYFQTPLGPGETKTLPLSFLLLSGSPLKFIYNSSSGKDIELGSLNP